MSAGRSGKKVAGRKSWQSFRRKFYLTVSHTVVLRDADHNAFEFKIIASDRWQEITIAPELLMTRNSQKPMSNWTRVAKTHFLLKLGSDLTKGIFAYFKWVS